MNQMENKPKSKGKKAWDIISMILTALIFIFVAYEVVLKFTNNSIYLFGYRADVVLSGSMEYKNEDPVVQSFLEGHDDQFAKGDLIYSVKIDADTPIDIYDVVMFKNPSTNLLTSHRVVEIRTQKGETYYRLRADTANKSSYDGYFTRKDLIAKKVGSTPWIGNIVNFLRSIYGMLMLIGLAVLMLIYTYFNNKPSKPKGEVIYPQSGTDAATPEVVPDKPENESQETKVSGQYEPPTSK